MKRINALLVVLLSLCFTACKPPIPSGMEKAFGCEVAQPDDKPTNGEFIALIADKLSMEYTA